MNALVPVSDIEKMANAIAKSQFFGMKTPEQAMALMFIAQAEGKHPASAAQEYHVIQGKPALKADAMLARFQAAGGKVEWKAYTDKNVTGIFSHPQGGTVEISWTIEMANAAKLTGKDTWKQYPRQMLRARVISEGIRTIYPGVAVGVYTPEEVADFDNGKVIDGTIEHSAETDPVTGEVNKAPPYFKTATLRNTFTKDIQEKLNKAPDAAEANLIIQQVKDKLDGMSKGDSRDEMALESIRNTYKLVLARKQTAEQNKRSTVPVEDGGLTPEEMAAWEEERAVMADKLADDPMEMRY